MIPLTPAPEPSINPFVDLPPLNPTIPSNDTTPGPYAICCCGGGRYYYKDVPKTAFSDCCCIQECCSQSTSSNLATSICGAGATTCSGIIIISSVLVVICVLGCVLSSVAYKRRRQRLDDVTASSRLGPEGAISQRRQRDSRRRTRQQDADQYVIQTLSSKEIDEMQVRSPDAAVLQTILEQQLGGGNKDVNGTVGDQSCPICLEKVTITEDNWAVFPCAAQHGCCRDCLKDLVKYTGARASAVAVHCPLCRKLAIVGYPSTRHSDDDDEHLQQVEEGTLGRVITLGAGGGEGGGTTTNEGRNIEDNTTTTTTDNNGNDNNGTVDDGTTEDPSVWRVVR